MLKFNEQRSQFENLNLDQFRPKINMDFQNWPIRYFDGLKHEYLRIIQMLCAITLMCYVFAFANVISTTSKVYQIEFFQNSVFFI